MDRDLNPDRREALSLMEMRRRCIAAGETCKNSPAGCTCHGLSAYQPVAAPDQPPQPTVPGELAYGAGPTVPAALDNPYTEQEQSMRAASWFAWLLLVANIIVGAIAAAASLWRPE
jgi:hypothetical protein